MGSRSVRLAVGAAAAAILLCGAALAGDGPLQDPPIIQSLEGRLDLIMTAVAAPVTVGGVQTTGWVYEVCRRASATATSCLPGTTQRPYGGVHLSLAANDTVHLRLVNRLPPVPGADHCADNPTLADNPTNLHLHGLIIEPHRAVGPGDGFGDYVFVEVRNPDNHAACDKPAAGAAMTAGGHQGHPDLDIAEGAVEYTFNLVNHPAGLYWFHPHIHGLSLNQVTSGLAGVLTVGQPADACGRDLGCRAAVEASEVRLLVLKDSEIQADGTLVNQQDPAFCAATPAAGEAPRQGACPGSADAGFAGGRWVHSINGQAYPDIHVGPGGDIWRMVNAAGSRSYDLSLVPDGGGQALPLQVLSIDGITVDAAATPSLDALQVQFAGKVQLFRCPGLHGRLDRDAVCTTHVRMMPSARVSVRVLNDRPEARHAVLRTADVQTGVNGGGDDWPQVDLASVALDPPRSGLAGALHLMSGVRAVLGSGGALGSPPALVAAGGERPVPVDRAQAAAARSTGPGQAVVQPGLVQAHAFAIDPELKLGLKNDPGCRNLAPGERRRIYFGNPTPGQDGFGLATAVIQADGREKPGSRIPMQMFDPTRTSVCLTAARGRRPTTETWELVNLTAEDHNFHIHQTRFWIASGAPGQPARIDDAAVLQDNVPVPHADEVTDCDGSIAKFEAGACKPKTLVVRIPFTQIGDFVFHCHILEHEDGGMMARIRVVAPPPLLAKSRQ